MQTLNIAWTFLKIGVIAFGGGWSTVGIIKNAVVPLWINEAEFSELIAIAQSTPGPIALNAATMIGWNHSGLLGAIAATLAVVSVPVSLIVLSTILAKRISVNTVRLYDSLRTGSIAMMIMTLWVLRPSSLDPLTLLYALSAFVVGAFTKINVLWALLGAGAFNVLLGPALRTLLGY